MFACVYFSSDNTLCVVKKSHRDLTCESFEENMKCSMKWKGETYEGIIIKTGEKESELKKLASHLCKAVLKDGPANPVPLLLQCVHDLDTDEAGTKPTKKRKEQTAKQEKVKQMKQDGPYSKLLNSGTSLTDTWNLINKATESTHDKHDSVTHHSTMPPSSSETYNSTMPPSSSEKHHSTMPPSSSKTHHSTMPPSSSETHHSTMPPSSSGIINLLRQLTAPEMQRQLVNLLKLLETQPELLEQHSLGDNLPHAADDAVLDDDNCFFSNASFSYGGYSLHQNNLQQVEHVQSQMTTAVNHMPVQVGYSLLESNMQQPAQQATAGPLKQTVTAGPSMQVQGGYSLQQVDQAQMITPTVTNQMPVQGLHSLQQNNFQQVDEQARFTSAGPSTQLQGVYYQQNDSTCNVRQADQQAQMATPGNPIKAQGGYSLHQSNQQQVVQQSQMGITGQSVQASSSMQVEVPGVRRSPRKKLSLQFQASPLDRTESNQGDMVELIKNNATLIDRQTLRKARNSAYKHPRPGYTLMAKLLPGVFTREEMARSRGQGLTPAKAGDLRPCLDSSKIKDCKDYVCAFCKENEFSIPNEKDLNLAVTQQVDFSRKSLKKT